jgi:hypothetical protein
VVVAAVVLTVVVEVVLEHIDMLLVFLFLLLVIQ